MVMHEILTLYDKLMGVMTEVKILKQLVLEMEAQLHQSSKHATAAKVGEEAVTKKTSYSKRRACGRSCRMRKFAVRTW